jgi:hypothetical protein
MAPEEAAEVVEVVAETRLSPTLSMATLLKRIVPLKNLLQCQIHLKVVEHKHSKTPIPAIITIIVIPGEAGT